MAQIRIGIVSWNTADLLGRCLASLPAALDGVDAEIVVVDNASEDDSVGVARRFDGVTVIANTVNLGYAQAMNQALAGSEAPVLVALNPDTEPRPGSIATLAAVLRDDPGVALSVPRLLEADGTLQHSVYPFPSLGVAAVLSLPEPIHALFGERLWLEGHARHDRARDIDWAIGAVHAIRRSALEDPQHPYSERWFMYVEDVDLCWRFREQGWRVRFEPRAEVVHIGNAAGAQAWGDTRTERWMAATYDWARRTRGQTWTLAWAVVTLAGLGVGAVAAWLRGRRDRARYRWWLLRINLRQIAPRRRLDPTRGQDR